jgi:hypothetical protein
MSWIPLALLVVSSLLSTIFLILQDLFHTLLTSGACEGCTRSLVHEHIIHPSSSYHQSIDLYLVLNDEKCSNVLLLVGLLPSNSTHLFWKLDLESYEYLEACSH